MRTVVTLAAALLLGMGHAANVNVVKWYGAQYATADALRAADPGLLIKRTTDGWVVTYKGRTLTMTDGSTKGQLDGQQINVGSPSRVIDGVAYLPFNDITMTLNVLGLTPIEGAVLAKSDYVAPEPSLVGRKITGNFALGAPEYPVQGYSRSGLSYSPVKTASTAQLQAIFQYISHRFSPIGDLVLTPETAAANCHHAVESFLKSPGSARYPATNVRVYPDRVWDIFGTVDSQNGYGALLRSNYWCYMRVNGDALEVVADISSAR